MKRGLLVLAWLLSATGASGQGPAVLRVTVALPAADGALTPVPRHALLVSDSPPTAAPRRVLTGPDGAVEIRLAPGAYVVESDRPVTFLGRSYLWIQMVDVAPGDANRLALTAGNAEVTTPEVTESPDGTPAPDSDPAFLLGRWQKSIVGVWSPTARGSGFLVDDAGLVVTAAGVVGGAKSVELELSPSLKVPARVEVRDARGAAVVRVAPSAVAGTPPLPMVCPPARGDAPEEGDEIMALVAPLRRSTDQTWGEVIGFSPRAIETDLRLPFGGAGAPVLNEAGTLVGLAVPGVDQDTVRRREADLVRLTFICDAVSAARAATTTAAAPDARPSPIEPERPYPAEALALAAADALPPPTLSSDGFDVAFLTPPVIRQGQQRADRTGGTGARSAEAEALLGRLTDFGVWDEYFVEVPPVLVVRVTPRLVEGFWKRLAREAARTQGAVLPPLKGFTGDFGQLRATCGEAEVAPIHPLVLEHRLGDKDVVREGLYIFGPDVFGPHCGSVTLSVRSATPNSDVERLVVDGTVLARVWADFAAWREGSGR